MTAGRPGFWLGALGAACVGLLCIACASRRDVGAAGVAPSFASPGAEIIEGDAFRHVVIRGGSALPAGAATGGALHVYIEGDGVPGSRYPASDPTSRAALMLRLMRIDPIASIYLGRPCYLGLAGDRHCNAHYWTDRRFSVEVVASMRAALVAEIARAGVRRVELFGHSGGATLAVLLAPQLEQVDGVMTIGGNLDTRAWTDLHGYAPLDNSLNPAVLGRLPEALRVVHLVGSQDRVVPPWLLRRSAEQIGGEVVVIQGFDHQCCWEETWRRQLAMLEPPARP